MSNFNLNARRCSKCKSLDIEGDNKWCAKCRATKRAKNTADKENRQQRDSVALTFGFDRNKHRRERQDIRSMFKPQS